MRQHHLPNNTMRSASARQACAWILAMLILITLSTSLHAQDNTTDSQEDVENTQNVNNTSQASNTAPTSESINFFGYQANAFANDVKRQITDFLLPVTVGEHVLNALHYQSITPRVKGKVLFITAGYGNSAEMMMYQSLSQVFVDEGFDTMIATLPIGEDLPVTLDEAGELWNESLSGIMNAAGTDAPYNIIYASGPVAATLLHLFDEQALTLPNALVTQDVFFAQREENNKIPGLIERFPNALLDLSQSSSNRWANATLKTRQQTIRKQGLAQKTQRKLYGMPISPKQRHLIYKEMTGWFKRIGWL